MILHELIHAKLWVELRHGRSLAFNGIAYNDKPEFQSRPYGPAFGIDEVVATLFSVRYHAKVMRSELALAIHGRRPTSFSATIDSMSEARRYAWRLITMLTTLQLGIEEASQKGLAPTPDELAFLPTNIMWQSLATDDIRLFLPAKISAAVLASILEFAKDAVPSFKEMVSVGAKLQTMTPSSKQQMREQAEKFLDLSEAVSDSFAASFPRETLLLSQVDGND